MSSVRSAPRAVAQLCSHTAQVQPLRSRTLSLLDHFPQAPHCRLNRVTCTHLRGPQQRPFASFATRQAEASTSSTPTSSDLPPTASSTTSPSNSGTASLKTGFSDQPIKLTEDHPSQIDWTSSFHGLSTEPFSKEAAEVLLKPVDPEDVEIKPDGILYLPEIKYRRILNTAFGPGGWGLAPRGESIVTPKTVTREYALLVHGRLVSIARGEQDYFSPDGIPTAAEGCKSNAMVRCCKDIGIASELWDPRFIRKFKAEKTREVFVEHVVSKKKTKIWVRKGDQVAYPFKETKFGS